MTRPVPPCHGAGVTANRSAATQRWLILYLLGRALAATVLGILLLVRPDDTVRTLAQISGILLLILGTIDMAASMVQVALSAVRLLVLSRGVLTFGAAVLLLALTDTTVTVIAIILGMQLVVSGGVSLLLSIRLRPRVAGWVAIALRGLVTLAIGVVALAWPERSVATLAVLFGVEWILSGLVSTTAAVRAASHPVTG